MMLEEFAEITRRVIAREGIDGFLPTACYPVRCHLKTLTGLPENVDVEKASLEWAEEGSDDEEILVAFKTDGTHFKVVRLFAGTREAEIFTTQPDQGALPS